MLLFLAFLGILAGILPIKFSKNFKSLGFIGGGISIALMIILMFVSMVIYDLGIPTKGATYLQLTSFFTTVPHMKDSPYVLEILGTHKNLTNKREINLSQVFKRSKSFLRENDYIKIAPKLIGTDSIAGWKIDLKVTGAPFRVNDTCYNTSIWLNDIDTVRIYLQGKGLSHKEIKITKNKQKIFLTTENHRLRLFKKPLREGYPLYTILRKFALKDTSFSRIFLKIGDLSSHILFVREKLGDSDSKLGLFIIPFRGDTVIKYKHGSVESIYRGEAKSIETSSLRPSIKIGLGYRNKLHFTLHGDPLTRKFSLNIIPPLTWKLPPTDTFLLMFRENDLPVDGFVLNFNNRKYNSIYKIERMGKYKFAIYGSDSTLFLESGKVTNLKTGDFGVTLKLWKLMDTKIHIPFVGNFRFKFMLLLVGIISLLLSLAIWWRLYTLGEREEAKKNDELFLKPKKVRSSVNYNDYYLLSRFGSMFIIVLTLLLIKLAFSYRLAASPPTNVTMGEFKNVFIKSIYVGIASILGFLLITLLLIILANLCVTNKKKKLKICNLISRESSGLSSWESSGKVRFKINEEHLKKYSKFMFYILGMFLLFLSKNEYVNLGLIRLRAYAFFLIYILGNYILFQPSTFPIFRKTISRMCMLPYHTFLLYIPTFIYLLSVKDVGVTVFIAIFTVLIFFSTCNLKKRREGIASRTGVSIVNITTKSLISVALLGLTPLFTSVLLKSNVVNPYTGKTAFFRLLVYKDLVDQYLVSFGQDIDERLFDNVYRNSVQAWQMKLYASEGGLFGKGIGNAKLSNVGLTYPTSLSDAAFSTVILPESGLIFGIFMLLLYLYLGLTILVIATKITETKAEPYTFPLLLVISILSIEPMYMAASNLQLLPFTGQNIPLLSFHSLSDSLFFIVIITVTWWIFLFKWLGHYAPNNTGEKIFGYVLFTSVILLALFLFSSAHVISNPHNKGDFDFSEKLKKELQTNAQHLRFNQKTHKVEFRELSPKSLNGIEKLYLKQLETRYDISNPAGGLYYVVDDSLIEVNSYYFHIPSPFRKTMGRVFIYGDEGEAPFIAFSTGNDIFMSLTTSGGPDVINCYANVSKIIKMPARAGCLYRTSVPIFWIKREKNSVVIDPQKVGNWKVFVNDKFVGEKAYLKKYDIVSISNNKGVNFQMVYLGKISLPLLYTVWRNGKVNRFLSPLGKDIPILYSLASFMDKNLNSSSDNKIQSMHLSINIDLQNALTQALKQYARINPIYRVKDPLKGKILSVSIVNLYNGNILAIAQWPPVEDDYQSILKSLYKIPARKHWRLLSSSNFKNHAIGSTIKPLTLSAIAYEFSKEISIDSLQFKDIADAFNFEGHHGHYYFSIAGIRLPSNKPFNCATYAGKWVDDKEFLTRSIDYYQIMLGMLGMLPKNTKYLKYILIPTGPKTANTKIGSKYYNLTYNLSEITKMAIKMFPVKGKIDTAFYNLQHEFPFVNNTVSINDINDILLFRGYQDLFGVNLVNRMPEVLKDTLVTIYKNISTTFLNIKHRTSLNILYNIVPEPVIFNRKYFRTIREDLLPFFLGGANNRWNNVKMAESFSRIVSGKRVEVSIIKDKKQEESFPDMPYPLSNKYWRYRNIIQPLENTWKTNTGTARYLKNFLEKKLPPGYKIIFKTGTIEESEGTERESEMLMFVFGPWDGKKLSFKPSSIAGYFYMQDSKATSGTMRKFEFFEKIYPAIKRYLLVKTTGIVTPLSNQ